MNKIRIALAAVALMGLAAVGYSASNAPAHQVNALGCCTGGSCCDGSACCR